MPYRHAHYWLAALLPLIGLAFWPGYFSIVRTAPLALHAHGLTAMLWVVLTMAQSWTIATRRTAWHRSLGLAMFVVVPLFAAGGVLALRGMATLAAAASDPFHIRYGARLGMEDLIAILTFLTLVRGAITRRRAVRLHAAYMLATVILVLPPILGRVLPAVPGFPHGLANLGTFDIAFYVAMALSAAVAGLLWRRDPRSGLPFAIVVAANGLQCLLFATIAQGPTWRGLFLSTAALPALPLAASGAAVAAAVMSLAWMAGSGVKALKGDKWRG